MFRAAIHLAIAACLAGCSDPAAPARSDNDDARTRAHLTITGSPESSLGATWVYRDTIDGVIYDLSGLLLKPPGAGPFPAVVLSHGFGGSATGTGRNVGAKMVPWGVVVITTNYTHAGSGPAGSPGTSADLGGSAANVQRARRAIAILSALEYVDDNRIAAHGHSMGAFVTTALAATHGNLLRVASHTAGGVRPNGVIGPAPPESQAASIRVPYQMHHGDRDVVVTLASDQRLRDVLQASGTVHELVVYPGYDHDDIPSDATMLQRLRAWYTLHGLF
jgi:dienelactone hydrolase